MFKHLLVPIDGSPMAEAAVPAAAYLAQKLGARVTLMHVLEKNAPDAVHGQPHLQHAQEAQLYLHQLAERAFPAEVRVEIHLHETEVENVAQSIVAHADELGHDLVVMCSHGRGAALHLFLGSIAQKVIALDSKPVLITHPDPEGRPPQFDCRHMLVPLDGDPSHALALPVSKDLARACGATLHLAMVIPDLTTLSGDIAVASKMLPVTTSRLLDLSSEDAEQYLKIWEDELRREGFVASAHVLRGDPAAMIVEAAVQAKMDLIVVATHGKTGMGAFWAGSVAHRICSQCRVPLLLIPLEKE